MEKANALKVTVLSVIGATGSFVTNLFGGWSKDLATLIIFMCIDFAMGLLIAAVWKKSDKSQNGALSSWSAWKGLCKKGVALLFVLIGHRLDVTMGTDYIRTAVIIGFIGNEIISIVEDAVIMGVPLLPVIAKAIDILKNKTEEAGK